MHQLSNALFGNIKLPLLSCVMIFALNSTLSENRTEIPDILMFGFS